MTDRDLSQPAETIGSPTGGDPDVDTPGLGVVDGDGADPSSLPMSDPFDGIEAVQDEERFEDWDDVIDHREALAEGARLDREEAEAEAAAQAEHDAKEAEMDAAHENGEAYHWGDTTHDGEPVQKWILPDGTTILVNAEGEAVSVAWPADSAPVYQGDIFYDGEVCAVYELPTGAEIVIDSEGTTVGMMDELEPDEIVIPGLEILLDGYQEGDGDMTVELVPTGPPEYDTQVINAETGDVVHTMDTGSTDPTTGMSNYHPPGADYYYVISPDGEVVTTLPEPVEPEWSLLGIVEYYEDGTVSVDLGLVEFDVDLVGPEQGISVTLDLIIVEGTVGVEWNEDGSWEFSTSAEVDFGALEAEGELDLGVDENGNPYIDVEGSFEMQMGILEMSGEAHAGFQLTDDGFEAYAGTSGEISVFGAYASVGGELTVVSGDEGFTATASASVGAGHHALGGWELTGETQFHTDGTWEGTSNTTGFHFGAEMDADAARAMGVTPGSETTGGVGVYGSTDDGVEVTDGKLDTGRDYERESDDGHEHTAPTGDADFDVDFEAPETENDPDDVPGPQVDGARYGATVHRTDEPDDVTVEQGRIDTAGARARTAGPPTKENDRPSIDGAEARAATERATELPVPPDDADPPGEPALRDAFDDITTSTGRVPDQQTPEPADALRVEAGPRADATRSAADRPGEPELVDDIGEAPRVQPTDSVRSDAVPEPDGPASPADRRIVAEGHIAGEVEPDVAAVFEPNDAEIVLDQVDELTLSEPERPLDLADEAVDHGFEADDDGQADGM